MLGGSGVAPLPPKAGGHFLTTETVPPDFGGLGGPPPAPLDASLEQVYRHEPPRLHLDLQRLDLEGGEGYLRLHA